MSFMVSAMEKKEINIMPETVVDEVLQNIWMILNTFEYDCPLARGLGLKGEFIDRPIATAKALSVADIYEKIEKYEPRAKVVGVDFESDYQAGKIYAKVEVEINANYEK